MGCLTKFSSWIVTAAALAVLPSAGWALSLSDKAALQAAMQQHIDERSVNGSYLHLNSKTGAVETLHPVTAHPMIMQMGKNYVLCFDFKNDAGKDVNVDFYLAPKNASYVVFHAAIDDRDVLHKLMKDGKVSRAE